MMDEVVQVDHQYDASWVTRPLKPGETIASVLAGHSEKLALAWNFVENPKTKRIQIAQNLRMCGDCRKSNNISLYLYESLVTFHGDATMKLIAWIRQCDIIVRDANRIHHFRKDGQCSCNDYF